MEDYFEDALKRVDIQLIRSFLLCGIGEPGEQDPRPRSQRIKEDEQTFCELLKQQFPDEDEFDKVLEPFFAAISANQGAYLEIGMKAGARLLHLLLLED